MKKSPLLATLLLCSTPYGIRGLAPKPREKARDEASQVLNALRHQRFGTVSMI